MPQRRWNDDERVSGPLAAWVLMCPRASAPTVPCLPAVARMLAACSVVFFSFLLAFPSLSSSNCRSGQGRHRTEDLCSRGQVMQRASLRLRHARPSCASALARFYSTAGSSANSEQLVRLEADHLPDGRPSGPSPLSSLPQRWY